MSWNIEVMCIHDRDLDVTGAVPDVFGPTDHHLCFEDATSSARGHDLCATRIGDWVVVIDVACRLSGYERYLEEVSGGRELHVFRIANPPRHVHYRDGSKLADSRGLTDCVAALAGLAEREGDGELVAQELLRDKTKLGFMDELWDAEYQEFTLD